ncbi:uncharacterized protein [Pseudorasbora parva]|uniref:uncharacterized protein isoform X1 n=1 Tax=Pseudorasbora parva TaxID=51549 RepID=UPI00351E7741
MFNSGDSPFHLKPLSVYSHIVCTNQQSNGSSPVYNIQVHISNNEARGQKRRLTDPCLDEICETPLKRPCFARTCSQDLGYCSSDFLSGVQGSTPLQPLIITKDVTPPRSKVNQPVTPVMSTPLSICKHNHIDRDRESLPSPIPVLKWDREVSSAEIKLCAFLNFNARSSVGFKGTGNGEVSQHDFLSFHESKSQSAPPESAVPLKEEEVVSVSQQAEPEEADGGRNEASASESFESTLPLQVQVKSKVVVPDNTKPICQLVVLCSAEEWERNKRTYVDSVKRHMKEQKGAENGISASHVSKVHQSPLMSGRKETFLPIDALLMCRTFSTEAQYSDLFILFVCFYCYIYLLSFHIFALCQCCKGEDHWFMLLVSCSLRSRICFCVFICDFTVCGVRLYCTFHLGLG